MYILSYVTFMQLQYAVQTVMLVQISWAGLKPFARRVKLVISNQLQTVSTAQVKAPT